MDTSLEPNPFIYGRPVRAGEFISRDFELRTIFNRLVNGESTAVIGEPHSGKTSLLLHIAHPVTLDTYLRKNPHFFCFSYLDLQSIGVNYTSFDFWCEALSPLRELDNHQDINRILDEAEKGKYSRRSLERIFSYLANQNIRLVVLLDEFERIITHPNFNDPGFFALLRSLSTRTGGLVFVLTSRLSLLEMNERGRSLLDTGSPFFNYLIPVVLRPFDDNQIELLLERAGEMLNPQDKLFIKRVAGSNPFLLQAMAATVLEVKEKDRLIKAAEIFYERISFHFDDLWNFMDDSTRTVAVVLSLIELDGNSLGQTFEITNTGLDNNIGLEISRLANMGLVEPISQARHGDFDRYISWQSQRWSISSQAFVWWVRDVVVSDVRSVPLYETWLTNKRYSFLLSQNQWDKLTSAVKKGPYWAVQGISTLVHALVKELAEK